MNSASARDKTAIEKEVELCLSCMQIVPGKPATTCPHCQAAVNPQAISQLDLPPGHILKGRYVLGRLLGRGGFGATYIAYDRLTKDRCAVKEYFPHQMVTRHQCQPQVELLKPRDFAYYQKRFYDEANQLTSLQHIPGMVKLYDVFNEHGTAYFVMEYVSGNNLKKHLKLSRGNISQQEALNILSELLIILQSVHENGVLHRDISADNICITEKGKVVLIDFGSARSTLENRMTVFHKGVYTAPEQLLGQAQGNFTDLYAVGVVLFELIMGRQPTSSEGTLEPMTRNPRSSLGDLNRVYLKATNPKAEKRYQIALDMRRELEDIQDAGNESQTKRESGRKLSDLERKKLKERQRQAKKTESKARKKQKKQKANDQKENTGQKNRKPKQSFLYATLIILSILFLLMISILILS